MKLARVATALLHGSAAAMFVGVLALVIAQVVMRKFFEPLTWSEELARYLFIWVAFLGWTIASARGSHVAIAQAADAAPPGLRRALGVLGDLGTLAFTALLVRYGLELVWNNRDIEAVSLPIPFALVYAAVPVAGAAIGLQALVRLANRFRTPEAPR